MKHLCLIAALLVGGFAAADDIAHPVLKVPRLAATPTIDGTVDLAEWRGASSITGVATHAAGGAPGQPPTVVPEVQQVTWFLGYDDKNLYIAMHSSHPEGTALTANIKKHDEGHRMLWDDHTEMQFSPRGRDYPGGFYKIMVNPRGYVSDQIWFSGTPGSEDLWQCGADIETRVTSTVWEIEMAIPFAPMGVRETPEGDRWVVNLVRTDFCGGIYFAGWVGAAWMSWDRFPEIEFAPAAPSFHLRSLGDLPAGELDAQIELLTRKPRETVTVQVRATDAEGTEIYADTRNVDLVADQPQTVGFQAADLPLTVRQGTGTYPVNHVDIVATAKGDAAAGEEDSLVYQASIPVIAMTEEYWNQFIRPWQERRETAGDYEFAFAHYPYSNQFEAWVDLDMFGVPEEIQAARSFRIRVQDANGKTVVSLDDAIDDKLAGHVLAEIPELAPGEYVAALELLGADGKVIADRQLNFVRRQWAWEHNDIGKDDIVIKPYIPVTATDNTATVWNRTVTLGPAGLPERITMGGGDRHAGKGPDLLDGHPITLAMTAAGETYSLVGDALTATGARPTTATFSGRGAIGPVDVATDVTVEYDGWYLVQMTLTPRQAVEVESLAMNWDLPGADTLVVMRGDVVEQGYYGAFPEGDGVVWDSTRLNPVPGLLGTWAPACFIGTAEKGLWYLAESDEGWVLDDDRPAITAERVDGVARLSFRFVNTPSTLDAPRTITFALVPTPVEPLPDNWRRTAWGRPGGLEYRHDTRGYRMYGASVDGFELYNEEDYTYLRNVYLGVEPPPKGSHGCRPMLASQRPYVLYGSGRMTGISREFRTFAGEWLGRTNYKPLLKPENMFKSRVGDAGIDWQTEDEVSPCIVNHCPSFIDYHLYYHKRLAEKIFLNGTWWDNGSLRFGGPLALGMSYVRPDGSVQGKSNLFAWREQTKRLNVMHWQVGHPPLYISNMHPLFSFTQIGWHIENSYHRFQGNHYAEYLGDNTGVEVFRALVKSKQGIISRFAYGGRVGWAMSLLHDIGNSSTPEYRADIYQELNHILMALEENVRFFSGDPKFIGYWRADNPVHFDPAEQVYASVYVHDELQPWVGGNPPRRQKAAIIIFNGGDERILEGFSIDPKPLGLPKISAITDVETGLKIPLNYNKEKGYRFGELYHRPETLRLPRHDFRVLIVE